MGTACHMAGVAVLAAFVGASGRHVRAGRRTGPTIFLGHAAFLRWRSFAVCCLKGEPPRWRWATTRTTSAPSTEGKFGAYGDCGSHENQIPFREPHRRTRRRLALADLPGDLDLTLQLEA